jgi:hypothetical protein
MMPLQTLSFDAHGNLGWRRTQGYGFARNLSLVQITGDELPRLAQDMPVAFRKLGSQWQAVAVLGPVPGVNLYVQADGGWRGRVIPKVLRSYPFELSQNHQNLTVWLSYCAETVGLAGVEPLFVNKQLAPALAAKLSLLKIQQKAINRLGLVLQFFADRHLLQHWQVPVAVEAAHLARHADLFSLDRDGLKTLGEEDWFALHRIMPVPAILELLHAHLPSLDHAQDFKLNACEMRSDLAHRLEDQIDETGFVVT